MASQNGSFIKTLLLKYSKLFKFFASSVLSFIIDYSAYAALLAITVNVKYSLIISNVFARVISSTVNYTVNRIIVFKHNGSVGKSALEYFCLAGFILFANTLLLELSVKSFSLPPLVAKLMVEGILFLFSWTIQRYVIFKKRDN